MDICRLGGQVGAMKDTISDDSTRIDELEVLFAHQERMLAELNEVITAQWRKIDVLERQLAKLRETFQAMEPPRSGPEPPPPHY